ncbi:MAG: aminotransferase class I/II-fold pyridoxal phosphate-dependent enzyme, partial [Simkaniaceae bacterium]|nr:aminotransferase class I/II-fold pyridoxal phosphate-dependent enzyme [Simkaniaceae bacterium]
YYDKQNNALLFDEMIDALKHLAENTVVLLHGSCHNPTGCDPTLEQWKEISETMKKCNLIPFFDVAYQGLGRGLDEDAEAVRLFAKDGHEMLVAFSFSKSFGLYGERTGALFVVAPSAQAADHVASMTKRLIRSNYSNPPRHGALIVRTVLGSDDLKSAWIDQLGHMQVRMTEMRNLLADKLTEKIGVDYSFMKKRYGLFSYTGLQEESVKKLIENYAIYMPNSGRINITGLNHSNIDTVVDAIKAVI